MNNIPLPIALYWPFCSAYSCLAIMQSRDIQARRNINFNLKIVLLLAIRDTLSFDSRSPKWLGYGPRDIIRPDQMKIG